MTNQFGPNDAALQRMETAAVRDLSTRGDLSVDTIMDLQSAGFSVDYLAGLSSVPPSINQS